ncbi:hypothetical protein BJ742DRAFT_432447 [Cladochytrium replicatum]|nr:hypothetical protein BJ742DRAFT_432447 [Cladochytrium replicatum]
MSKSIVLEEEFDQDYDPSEDEVIEYARFLGIDPESEKQLLWIARESLKAPLPEDWKPCQTEDNNVYYFNFKTGESIWDHPCDEHYRKLYEREKAKGKPAEGSSELSQTKPQETKAVRTTNTASTLPQVKPQLVPLAPIGKQPLQSITSASSGSLVLESKSKVGTGSPLKHEVSGNSDEEINWEDQRSGAAALKQKLIKTIDGDDDFEVSDISEEEIEEEEDDVLSEEEDDVRGARRKSDSGLLGRASGPTKTENPQIASLAAQPQKLTPGIVITAPKAHNETAVLQQKKEEQEKVLSASQSAPQSEHEAKLCELREKMDDEIAKAENDAKEAREKEEQEREKGKEMLAAAEAEEKEMMKRVDEQKKRTDELANEHAKRLDDLKREEEKLKKESEAAAQKIEAELEKIKTEAQETLEKAKRELNTEYECKLSTAKREQQELLDRQIAELKEQAKVKLEAMRGEMESKQSSFAKIDDIKTAESEKLQKESDHMKRKLSDELQEAKEEAQASHQRSLNEMRANFAKLQEDGEKEEKAKLEQRFAEFRAQLEAQQVEECKELTADAENRIADFRISMMKRVDDAEEEYEAEMQQKRESIANQRAMAKSEVEDSIDTELSRLKADGEKKIEAAKAQIASDIAKIDADGASKIKAAKARIAADIAKFEVDGAAKIAALKKDIEGTDSRFEQLQGGVSVEQRRVKLALEEVELDNLEKRIARRRVELEAQSGRLDSALSTYMAESRAKKIACDREEAEEEERDLAERRHELASQRSALDKAERDITATRGRISDLKSEMERERMEVELLSKRAVEERETVDKEMREIERLRREVVDEVAALKKVQRDASLKRARIEGAKNLEHGGGTRGDVEVDDDEAAAETARLVELEMAQKKWKGKNATLKFQVDDLRADEDSILSDGVDDDSIAESIGREPKHGVRWDNDRYSRRHSNRRPLEDDPWSMLPDIYSLGPRGRRTDRDMHSDETSLFESALHHRGLMAKRRSKSIGGAETNIAWLLKREYEKIEEARRRAMKQEKVLAEKKEIVRRTQMAGYNGGDFDDERKETPNSANSGTTFSPLNMNPDRSAAAELQDTSGESTGYREQGTLYKDGRIAAAAPLASAPITSKSKEMDAIEMELKQTFNSLQHSRSGLHRRDYGRVAGSGTLHTRLPAPPSNHDPMLALEQSYLTTGLSRYPVVPSKGFPPHTDPLVPRRDFHPYSMPAKHTAYAPPQPQHGHAWWGAGSSRRVAWESGHVRSEAGLAEQNTWLKEFKSRQKQYGGYRGQQW